jgi:hypothetical protein
VSKQQFEREYAPKLTMRENVNARSILKDDMARVYSPDVPAFSPRN